MPKKLCRSPFTGNAWNDPRPLVATLAGVAHRLNSRRPRRRPPPGMDEAIAAAVDNVRAYAGLPRLERADGKVVSDAYWAANEAACKLTPFVDEAFRKFSRHWAWRDEDGQIQKAFFEERRRPCEYAARFAWWATWFVQRVASAKLAMDDMEVEHFIYGVQAELEAAGVELKEAAYVERVSQFFAAAGRFPGADDRDLYDAFEAALMADEPEFARHLAAHGWGQPDEDAH